MLLFHLIKYFRFYGKVRAELTFPVIVLPSKASVILIPFLHHPGRGDLTPFEHYISQVCVAVLCTFLTTLRSMPY